MNKINMTINIEQEDLCVGNSDKEIIDFIKSVDLSRASVDFSLALIKELALSLSGDMSLEEVGQFLAENK